MESPRIPTGLLLASLYRIKTPFSNGICTHGPSEVNSILMKSLFPFLSVLLLIPCADSQEVVTGPFVIRENVIYHENTNEPVTGTVEEFYENGQLKERRNYRDGVREGLGEMFHENSQLSTRGGFKSGRADGLWERFYEDGQLERRLTFKDGKPEGLAELFHDNGQLAGRRNWKNGELEGLWETFDENGQLTESEIYKNGALQ